jgi:hypothetical protein
LKAASSPPRRLRPCADPLASCMRAADAALARRAVKGRIASLPRRRPSSGLPPLTARLSASAISWRACRTPTLPNRVQQSPRDPASAGESADAGYYSLKTKDRCLTPTRGLWFSNTSGAAHHLPDLPDGRSLLCAAQSTLAALCSRSRSTTVSARLAHDSGRGEPSRAA